MALRHSVITCVDGDDTPGIGVHAFVGVIREIRRQPPSRKIAVPTPDFRGAEMPLAKAISECPDVLNGQRRGRAATVPGCSAWIDPDPLEPRAARRERHRQALAGYPKATSAAATTSCV